MCPRLIPLELFRGDARAMTAVVGYLLLFLFVVGIASSSSTS